MGMQPSRKKEGIIALDGKVVRGTLDKINVGKATKLVNAWSVAYKLCFRKEKSAYIYDLHNKYTHIWVYHSSNGIFLTTIYIFCIKYVYL